MEKVLSGLPGIKIYQDDILIFGKDVKEHDSRLRAVLSKLNSYNLTIRPEKCKFRTNSIDYLGHTITGSGVVPKNELINTICRLSSPTNKEELMHFLGMTEYYKSL